MKIRIRWRLRFIPMDYVKTQNPFKFLTSTKKNKKGDQPRRTVLFRHCSAEMIRYLQQVLMKKQFKHKAVEGVDHYR